MKLKIVVTVAPPTWDHFLLVSSFMEKLLWRFPDMNLFKIIMVSWYVLRMIIRFVDDYRRLSVCEKLTGDLFGDFSFVLLSTLWLRDFFLFIFCVKSLLLLFKSVLLDPLFLFLLKIQLLFWLFPLLLQLDRVCSDFLYVILLFNMLFCLPIFQLLLPSYPVIFLLLPQFLRLLDYRN